ncbi:MAG TPA: hypothetical protein VMW24_23120 [Sedimentisphaerales bacterium]|nr:hypothetical protein [Sedimentisphaerales bacterium]
MCESNQQQPLHEIEILKDLRDAALDRYDKRRNVEWKVTAGLWAAIVLITGAAADKASIPWHLIALPYCVIYTAYVIWQSGSWRASWNNFQRAEKCRKELEQHATKRIEHEDLGFWFKVSPKRQRSWCGFLCDWSRLSQIIGTGALLFFSACVLAGSCQPTTVAAAS